jgi:hypothetical protein
MSYNFLSTIVVLPIRCTFYSFAKEYILIVVVILPPLVLVNIASFHLNITL